MLAYAHENDVEPFLEPALHLLSSLLNDVGTLGWAGRGATGLGLDFILGQGASPSCTRAGCLQPPATRASRV